MKGSASKPYLVHGKHHRLMEFVLAINGKPETLRSLPDVFVVHARSKASGAYRQVAVAAVRDVIEARQCGVLKFVLDLEADETSLRMGYIENPDQLGLAMGSELLGQIIPILDNLPLRFQVVAWRPKLPDGDDPRDDRARGWIDLPSPFHAPGKWQVGHAFCKKGDFPIIFLWRCEIPAHFEMHSHVMSNHCAPLPAIWEKNALAAVIEPGYATQDALTAKPQVLGEAGEIGKMPTPEIAKRFAAELAGTLFHEVFPFLARDHTTTGCVMPMDMEYMHFDGYFGTPITQFSNGKWWYCWNKMWKKSTNNISRYVPPETSDQKGSMVEPEAPTPTSSHDETWSYMTDKDGNTYKRWHHQLIHHGLVFLNSLNLSAAESLPFYHFDPRRYTNLGRFSTEKTSPIVPFASMIPSSKWDGASFFFGFKLYTAMGWAPEDPLLKEPLKEFYELCEREDIPLLNHCTPEGFYTQDRKFYYDLLKGQKMIAENAVRDGDGWPRSFSKSVLTPNGHKLPEPKDQGDKIWWFVQNYVSPAAWSHLVQTHKKLKLCLAHFGDSVHLDEKGWGDRKDREPKGTPRDLTIAFDGARIDRNRTHSMLADLIDLVQPDNRIFIDLSYVTLNERNSLKFQDVFDWARLHKPILLERVLWGTDWPLLGNEPMVTAHTGGPILYRYALAFRNRLPRMPGDFFLRTCFLNPLQYLGLAGLSDRLTQAGHPKVWPWLGDVPPSLFTDFQADKLEIYYRHEKKLVHPLG